MAKATNTTTPSKFNKSSVMKRAWADAKKPVIVSTVPLPEQLASLRYAHKLNQMSGNFYATNGGHSAAMRQIRTLESQIATEGRVAA